MCGICGSFSFSGEKLEEKIKTMNDFHSCRGPDDEGLESFDFLTFG